MVRVSEGLPQPSDHLATSTLEEGFTSAGGTRGRGWRWLRGLVAGDGETHAGPFLHLRQLRACFPGSGGGLGQRRRRAPLRPTVSCLSLSAKRTAYLPAAGRGSIFVRALTHPISQSRDTGFDIPPPPLAKLIKKKVCRGTTIHLLLEYRKLYLTNIKTVLMKCTFSQQLFIIGDLNFYRLFMIALTVIQRRDF